MKIPAQKTYKGRTGGGWIRRAEVCRSLAGPWAVFVDQHVVTIAPISDCILDDGYTKTRLILSTWAFGRLARLIEHADDQNRHDIRMEPDYDIRRDHNPNSKEN